MQLSKFTSNTILELDKLFNSKIYSHKYIHLDKLYLRSLTLIKYILNNYKIVENTTHILKKNNYKNLTIAILKGVHLDSITNKKMYEFIKKIKNDTISFSDIERFNNYNNNDINILISNELLNNKVNSNITKLLKIYSENIISKFVPLNIQSDILMNLNIYTKIIINLDNIKLTFIFFSKKAVNNYTINIIFIKALYLIKLYNIDEVELTIHCFLSNIKKKIRQDNFLGPNEVNSGLTSFGLKNNILIFRSEEIEKVLLHELVHALNIDTPVMRDLDLIDHKIKCNFNVNNKNNINFFETYTESIAFITNIMINSIFSQIDYKILLENELRFSIIQCSKIMNFYNIKNMDDFFCKNCCFPSNKYWIEKSSILSYFFLKLGSIYNADLFIANYMFSDKINIDIYYNFIINNFNKIKLLYNKTYTTSLRMTLYDFDWTLSF